MNDTSTPPVALAIGAGDAIGAAVARRFAAGGYRVAVARRKPEMSAGLVDEIAASGGTLKAYAADARDEAAVTELFDQVEADLGPIDVVLYNAGANYKSPALDTDPAMFRKVWELSCFGGFLAGKEAARRMVPRGQGTILFTGATASMRGGAGFAAFASAKFGLRAVAQSLARELGPEGIHVAHLVIDGGVDSPAIHARRRAAAGDDTLQFAADSLIDLASVAEAYWMLSQQSRDGWTHELDIRPFAETW